MDIKNYKFKTKPFDHQMDALVDSWDKENFAYFMEMGTGKSKVLLDNAAVLYDRGLINGLLLIAPKGVYKNWFDSEIPVHLPDHIHKKVVLWKTSDKSKKQKEILNTLFKTGTDLHILIMNVETFSTGDGTAFAQKFLSCHKTMIAIDESTTIKTPTSNRTKNILKLSDDAKYRRILTGSPVTKSPLDLYSQCLFLDPWLLGHQSYYTFRARYSIVKKIQVNGRHIEVVVGYKNLGELSDKIKPFSKRILKEDCLDLPEKTFVKHYVELTKEQQKVYNQMKQEAIAFLDGKMQSSATVMTQLMRLHQITCGHFTADDGTIKDLPCSRLTELMNVLENIEGKTIIWSHYTHDVKRIIKEIKKVYGEDSVVDYYGATDTDARSANIKKFQTDDKCRFFVGTTHTGGYGITLTAGSNMVYFSNGYDLEKRQQSEARIDRIGQTRKMTYIDIMAQDTIDERIVKALRTKVNIANAIMDEDLKDWI
ncbi:MAG: DEAD/DEAH box helicase [Candidatus Pelagibacter bacterium]|nr:DEAD/DEAH box helicase [Candidatus Pelagibacter bacterium]